MIVARRDPMRAALSVMERVARIERVALSLASSLVAGAFITDVTSGVLRNSALAVVLVAFVPIVAVLYAVTAVRPHRVRYALTALGSMIATPGMLVLHHTSDAATSYVELAAFALGAVTAMCIAIVGLARLGLRASDA